METQALADLTTRVRGATAAASLSLEASLGRIAQHMDGERKRAEAMRLIHPVPITCPQPVLTAGAGTINQPDMLGPHDGYYWDVRHLTAAGFTVGSVSVYLNYQADENLKGTFPQPGILTFSGNLMLGDSDALIFVCTGITGQVTIGGQAVNIPSRLVPWYLL